MKLSEKIVFMRKKRNISQDQLARRLNVSRQAVYKWEAGINTPELDKIYKLAEIFNISYDLLLDEKIDLNEYFDLPSNAVAYDFEVGEEATDGSEDTDTKKKRVTNKKGLLAIIIACASIMTAALLIVMGIIAYKVINSIYAGTDTDTGTDIVIDTDSNTGSDTDIDTDSDTDSDTDIDTDSDTDSDINEQPTPESTFVTVTLLAGGENMLSNKELVLEVGKPVGTLPRPFITGHIFIGWYEKSDTEFKNLITENTIVTESMTELTAFHMIDNNNPPAIVSFNPNGGIMDENDEGRFVVIGTSLGELPFVEKEGYTLVGWYNTRDGYYLYEYTETTVITGEVYEIIPLIAVWRKNVVCIDGTMTHTWWRWKTESEGSCKAPEKQGRTCSACGLYESKYVPNTIKDHTFGAWSELTAGNCSTPTVFKRECTVCKYTETKTEEAAGEHTWSVWKEQSAASCESTSIVERICVACGEKEQKEGSDAALGHNYINGQCSRCFAYQYTEGVVYQVSNGKAYVSSYSGKEQILKISPIYTPVGESVSYPVTKIANLTNESIREIIIPEGVEELSDAQWQCPYLSTVRIPTTLKKIGEETFKSCPITKVFIKDVKAWCGISSNTESIEGSRKIHSNYDMYLNDELLVDLEISADIATVGSYVFCGCQSIRTVTMEECSAFSNRKILTGAFSSTGLRSAQISAGSVMSKAFYMCNRLISVDITEVVDFAAADVFDSSQKIFEVYTSATSLKPGDTGYGGVAINAKIVHHGKDEASVICETVEGLVFGTVNNVNYLLEYKGSNSELKLPRSYKGEAYIIARFCFAGSLLDTLYVPKEITQVEFMGLYKSDGFKIYCETSSKPNGWNTIFATGTTVSYNTKFDY